MVTKDPAVVASADRVAAGRRRLADCRRGLDAVDGMVGALDEAVRKKGEPGRDRRLRAGRRGREYELTEAWAGFGEVDRIVPRDPNENPAHGAGTRSMSRDHTPCSTA